MTLLSHEHLGHGLGTEATRLVLTYGFAVLGLHRVTARVLSFNERALACLRAECYNRIGIPEIGWGIQGLEPCASGHNTSPPAGVC